MFVKWYIRFHIHTHLHQGEPRFALRFSALYKNFCAFIVPRNGDPCSSMDSDPSRLPASVGLGLWTRSLALAGSHVALRKKQSAHQLGEREGEGASMTLAVADALFICRPVTSFSNTTDLWLRRLGRWRPRPHCLSACLPACQLAPHPEIGGELVGASLVMVSHQRCDFMRASASASGSRNENGRGEAVFYLDVVFLSGRNLS